MKRLSATATRRTPATIEQAYALLVDVDGYPRWHPQGVPSAATVSRDADGTVTEARAGLAVHVGPLNRVFNVRMAVHTVRPSLVEMSRIPHPGRDPERLTLRWILSAPSGGGTDITVQIDAELSVPPLVPVGSAGDGIASGFADAAVRELAR